MRESLYKLVCWILLLSALLVWGYDFVHAQASAIRVEVSPKVVVFNDHSPTTFHFRWVIEPDENNRLYALSYGCGIELHSSQREINGNSAKFNERYVSLTVLGDCDFMACVVRIVDGKPKTICVHRLIPILQEEEP